MPSRYGDFATALNPAHILPPITSGSLPPRVARSATSPWAMSGKRTTVSTASSINTADTSNTFTAPILLARAAVVADPSNEPSVPPTPINPNNRLACSLLNESAIKHQKIDVLNSANTVTHTKNVRPIHTSAVDPSPVETNRSTT